MIPPNWIDPASRLFENWNFSFLVEPCRSIKFKMCHDWSWKSSWRLPIWIHPNPSRCNIHIQTSVGESYDYRQHSWFAASREVLRSQLPSRLGTQLLHSQWHGGVVDADWVPIYVESLIKTACLIVVSHGTALTELLLLACERWFHQAAVILKSLNCWQNQTLKVFPCPLSPEK